MYSSVRLWVFVLSSVVQCGIEVCRSFKYCVSPLIRLNRSFLATNSLNTSDPCGLCSHTHSHFHHRHIIFQPLVPFAKSPPSPKMRSSNISQISKPVLPDSQPRCILIVWRCLQFETKVPPPPSQCAAMGESQISFSQSFRAPQKSLAVKDF